MGRVNMGRVYLPTRSMLNTLSFSVETFMEDILRLIQEYETEISKYRSNLHPQNPALFKARAKWIEQCLLLGDSAEHLLKAILLKHGFILNKSVQNMPQKKFSTKLLTRIKKFNESNKQNQDELDSIFHAAQSMFPSPVSGRTINFGKCIRLFYAEVVHNVQSYFSSLPNKEYRIANEETKRFYGEKINTSNALKNIKTLRNNYVHFPEPMYEERGLFPFLYNFLVFIAQKEFPNATTDLRYIS